MFDLKNVTVKMRNPLLAPRRHLKKPQGVTNIGLYCAPVEFRVAIREVTGRDIPQHIIHSDLRKFVEQRIDFPVIERIGELADQVRSADEARLRIGFAVIVIIGHGKTR